MDAIILAAGKGTRMGPLSKVPKPLLQVAGKPLIGWLIDDIRAAGASQIHVVVEHMADQFEALGDVNLIRQGEPKGTGHAVSCAADHVDDDAVLVMGDAVFDADSIRAVAAASGFTVASAEVDNPQDYGVLETDGNSIIAVHEKSAEPPSNLVNTGLYKLTAEALQASRNLKPSPRGELEFTDVVTQLDARHQPVQGWVDVGRPWQLLDAQAALVPRAMLNAPPLECDGPGTIHGYGEVKGAYVEGAVYLGEGATVGPNSYLRGPVSLGAGAKVGSGCEIKNSLLLPGAKAPHLSYVGDSVLGHGSNLGAGTQIANLKLTPGTIRVDWDGQRIDSGRRKLGAIVGDDAKTGVNSSLNPGTILGRDAIVGAGRAAFGWVPDGSALLG